MAQAKTKVWMSCAVAAGDRNEMVKETVLAELSAYTDELTSFSTISYKTKNDVTALVARTIQNLIKHELAGVEPFMLNAIRFGISSVIILLVFRKRLSLERKTLKFGAILGLLMFTFYLTGAFGARLTTVSNAGFLCCLAVIITPLIDYSDRKSVV